VYTKLFTDSKTKNIWVYGLDDDDEFEVKGNKKSNINIRLIRQNHDIYTVTNGRKTKIIDFKSKINMLLIQKLKKID
jgi:hypothetical protein